MAAAAAAAAQALVNWRRFVIIGVERYNLVRYQAEVIFFFQNWNDYGANAPTEYPYAGPTPNSCYQYSKPVDPDKDEDMPQMSPDGNPQTGEAELLFENYMATCGKSFQPDCRI